MNGQAADVVPGFDGLFGFVLHSVRALDSGATEEAVRRFVTEIAEADSTIAAVEQGIGPLPTGFSPAWHDSAGR